MQIIRIEDPEHITALHIDSFKKKWWVNGLVPEVKIEGEPLPVQDMHRTILITAREHATEHTSSWIANGILNALLEDSPAAARLRKDTTWLIVPILDPDGSANSRFDSLTNHFWYHQGEATYGDYTPTEVVVYAAYLRAFVNSGRAIDVALSLHNIECNEGPIIFSPFAIYTDREVTVAFNQLLFNRLTQLNIPTGKGDPLDAGVIDHRICGWCARSYGSLFLAFEVNDRYPQQRLSLQGLDMIGSTVARALSDFLMSTDGRERAKRTRDTLAVRKEKMEQYWKTSAWPADNPSIFDMLSMGY